MSISKPIVINRKGMITIPVDIRKKFNLNEGTEIAIVELEGVLTIIPIYDIENTVPLPLKDIIKSWDTDYEEELRLEQ